MLARDDTADSLAKNQRILTIRSLDMFDFVAGHTDQLFGELFATSGLEIMSAGVGLW
jgi:hypothetical protein